MKTNKPLSVDIITDGHIIISLWYCDLLGVVKTAESCQQLLRTLTLN